MSTISTLVLALTAHPAVYARAQAEVDRVVGRTRWPAFADRDSLPYVGALVREVCRWRPVAPLIVPHASTQDDVYNGYFIPKGTTVISAIWYVIAAVRQRHWLIGMSGYTGLSIMTRRRMRTQRHSSPNASSHRTVRL